MHVQIRFFYILPIILLVFVLVSCGPSTEDIARQTQRMIVDHHSNERGQELSFRENLVLVRRSNTEFTGIGEVIIGGRVTRLAIDVVADSRNIQVEWREIR